MGQVGPSPPVGMKLGHLQAADEDVDDVVAAGRLQTGFGHHAGHFRFGKLLIIGADEDGSDRPLHIHGLGGGEEKCKLIQALAIAQPMARQRVEGANLRGRSPTSPSSASLRAKSRT